MSGAIQRSPLTLALCAALLMGCSHTSERPSKAISNMPTLALVDNVCALCHGLTGESVSPMIPKLAGQQKDYLKAQLMQFKAHSRMDKAATEYMWGFTHLTDTQIAELADYFAAQPPMQAPAQTSDARGELIFRRGVPAAGIAQCSACHGAQGQGQGQTPRVAGQHAAYMVSQLNVFQQADLRQRGDLSSEIAHTLSDADAESVAQYMARLGRAPSTP